MGEQSCWDRNEISWGKSERSGEWKVRGEIVRRSGKRHKQEVVVGISNSLGFGGRCTDFFFRFHHRREMKHNITPLNVKRHFLMLLKKCSLEGSVMITSGNSPYHPPHNPSNRQSRNTASTA